MSAAEMREALKPCPFCGGEAEMWQTQSGRTAWAACMGRCAVLVSKEYKTDEEAIAAWNRRAPLPDDEGMAERVARAIASVYGLNDFAPFYEDARAAIRAINGGKP